MDTLVIKLNKKDLELIEPELLKIFEKLGVVEIFLNNELLAFSE